MKVEYRDFVNVMYLQAAAVEVGYVETRFAL